jgi:hypothetical protein
MDKKFSLSITYCFCQKRPNGAPDGVKDTACTGYMPPLPLCLAAKGPEEPEYRPNPAFFLLIRLDMPITLQIQTSVIL